MPYFTPGQLLPNILTYRESHTLSGLSVPALISARPSQLVMITGAEAVPTRSRKVMLLLMVPLMHIFFPASVDPGGIVAKISLAYK
jgi:hypothetical protein